MASQAQTAQAATNGRCHLGLAVGSAFAADAFGLPFELLGELSSAGT